VTEALPPNAFDGQTLLAIFAHPDDESITCGGLLAACSARGARVALLCVTRGEAGPSVSTDRTSLGARRAEELRDATATLGVTDVEVLGHPDGMLPWTDSAALERDILQAIQRVRPDVVVTFGADGLYWHPDHIAIHERVTAVVQALGDTGPALYYATMPPGAMQAVFDRAYAHAVHLGEERPRQILGIAQLDAFGAHAQPPTLVVDASQYAPAKLAALRHHASQLVDDALTWLTPDDATLLGIEHFHRAGSREGFIERLGR
jgi:LmbE family N-acetylglucosaminyl deacetylase